MDAHGALTAELIASGATHLAGDYWKIWPAVFHYQLVTGKRLWGLSDRSEAIRALWSAVPLRQSRVAVIRGDPEGPKAMQMFGFGGFAKSSQTPQLDLLTATGGAARPTQ